MPKRVRDYEEDLIKKLKDTEFAVEYLRYQAALLADVCPRIHTFGAGLDLLAPYAFRKIVSNDSALTRACVTANFLLPT